jgi:DNA-binding response OmpR family regulator
VSKPSHPDELLAVINAVIRRRVTPTPAASCASSNAPATLNQRTLTLHGPAGEIAIGERPALMLGALALAPGNRLENWQLIEAMREDPDAYTKAALEVRMVRLRQSFKAVGFDGVILRALRTTGYQLCVPVKVV